jgi:YfiH family protein
MINHRKQEQNNQLLHWYSSSHLKISHGMLCRHGGFSAPPYESLNLSYGVADLPEAVEQNRQQLRNCFAVEYLVSAVQVHGQQIAVADNIRKDTEFSSADALITSQPGVGLLIQQADCQAILLHDPVQKVIGAIHCGWQGSTVNIITAAINAMQEQYQVRPSDLRAVISPSLGPCCSEFKNYQLELPQSFNKWQIRPNYFDFWAISRFQLTGAGIKGVNIETTGICTRCNRDFFSYRRAVHNGNGITGRNGSIIVL